jgi:ribonuclease P protein component
VLKKQFRLPISSTTSQRSISIRGKTVIIKKYNPQYDYCRFGVIISKRAHKSAAKRNILKRQMWSFIANHHSKFPQADYLFIIQPPMNQYSAKEIKEELDELFLKL